MAHSRNENKYHNTVVRITTHPIRKRIEACISIINPLTRKPYTCKDLSLALQSLVEKDSLNKATAEVWLGRIGPIENLREEKVFILYCSGTTKEEARKKAEEKCQTGELSSLLRMLGEPVWKRKTKAGQITFREYIDFLGDNFYSGCAPRTASDIKSALNKQILPVIGDVQIQNADEKWQKHAANEIRNRYEKKVPSSCCLALKRLFSSIHSNNGPLHGNVETLCAALKPTRMTISALNRQAFPAHLDDKQRSEIFQALYAMECPRLLLIVSLIYCGLSLAELLALHLDEVQKTQVRGEPVYTYVVDKYYLSNDGKDSLTRVRDSKFSFPSMRRIVLSPLAVACMERYKQWLHDHHYVRHTDHFVYQLNHTPNRRESLADLKKRLTDFLASIGIQSREIPVQQSDGQTKMQERTVNENLLLYDAKWVLTKVCNANFVMCNTTFGLAAQTTDESHYLDQFGDLYALARYYQLARFSPFSPLFAQAQLDQNVLRTPVGVATNSTWELCNPTTIPKTVVVQSSFPVQLTIRM